MPLSFPSGAITIPTGTPVPRSIGSVNLNDHINTWTDGDETGFTRENVYERVANTDGIVIRTRRARVDAKPIIYGIWIDGHGKGWNDFLYALESVDGGELVLADGLAYAQADVLSVSGKRQPGVERDPITGRLFRWYRWSIQFQAFSALRIAGP